MTASSRTVKSNIFYLCCIFFTVLCRLADLHPRQEFRRLRRHRHGEAGVDGAHQQGDAQLNILCVSPIHSFFLSDSNIFPLSVYRGLAAKVREEGE